MVNECKHQKNTPYGITCDILPNEYAFCDKRICPRNCNVWFIPLCDWENKEKTCNFAISLCFPHTPEKLPFFQTIRTWKDGYVGMYAKDYALWELEYMIGIEEPPLNRGEILSFLANKLKDRLYQYKFSPEDETNED
jgi:hypothetical protein